MKKYLIYTGFIAVVFLLNGCIEKGRKKYKKTYYPSGTLKSYGYYINDSIPVDTIFTFYEKGRIQSKEVYNSIGNAVKSTSYFENGILREEINYNNGLANDFGYVYTASGNVYKKSYFINDNRVGDAFFYNQIGNQIRTYSFFDWDEKPINLIKYDSVTGKVMKNMRQTIYLDSVETYKDKQKLWYKLMLVISNPPHYRSSVKVEYLTKEDVVIKTDSITGKPYYFSKAQLKDSLFAIRFIGNQYDSLAKQSYEQWNKRMINR